MILIKLKTKLLAILRMFINGSRKVDSVIDDFQRQLRKLDEGVEMLQRELDELQAELGEIIKYYTKLVDDKFQRTEEIGEKLQHARRLREKLATIIE